MTASALDVCSAHRPGFGLEQAGVEIAPTGACAQPSGRAERDPSERLPPAARFLIHDVKQRWAPPEASPGCRPAASRAARGVAVHGDRQNLRSRTPRHRRRRFLEFRSDGRAARARPGRSAEASFTAGRLFRWGYWSSKAACRQSRREALRDGRVQGRRGKPCPIGEGSSKNRSSDFDADPPGPSRFTARPTPEPVSKASGVSLRATASTHPCRTRFPLPLAGRG